MSKYKNPIKTAWMEEQMNHEPSRDYADNIQKFVRELKPDYKKAVEIGSAWGISTLAILGAGDGLLTSVDPNETHAFEEVNKNGYGERWDEVRMKSEGFWAILTDQKFDLIYIDGSHLFNDVYNDLNQAWLHLEKGGLLMIDDFTHKNNLVADESNGQPIYGISYALCRFISEKNIENQKTGGQVWATVKEK